MREWHTRAHTIAAYSLHLVSSVAKAPLFTRHSHSEDAAKPAPLVFEKCPVQPVNAAEATSVKKADSLSRLFAMMQPSSGSHSPPPKAALHHYTHAHLPPPISTDKDKEGPTTDKPVLPEPDLDQERFQTRREELILRYPRPTLRSSTCLILILGA
jgi:hypothetical protein